VFPIQFEFSLNRSQIELKMRAIPIVLLIVVAVSADYFCPWKAELVGKGEDCTYGQTAQLMDVVRLFLSNGVNDVKC
jgi:hypothetical protein